MDLYIIRHADAIAVGERGVKEDAERPLSTEGKSQARTLAKALQAQGVHFNKILTSPLVRARQTAEQMLRDWPAPAPEIINCDQLAPGVKPRRLAEFIAAVSDEKIALVGHQPDLSDWTAWLIGSKKAQIDFSKSGVAHVTCVAPIEKGAGTLIWLLTPDWLRNL